MQFSTKNFKSQSNFLTSADNCAIFHKKTFIEKITESQTLKYRGLFHIFKILVNCASGRFSKFLTI